MTKKQLQKIKSFAALCEALGKDETHHVVESGRSAAEKEIICQNRLRIIYNAWNGDKRPDIANTSESKYLPGVWINEDKEAPFGFRLSFRGVVHGLVSSDLGARPYLLDSSDVEPVFEQWREEHEALVYWSNQAQKEA